MHVRLRYGSNTYGNEDNAPGYSVKIERFTPNSRNIDIDFELDSPAAGRGMGPLKSDVRSIHLSLPAEACKALSHALQVALADITRGAVTFRIDEADKAQALTT